jgi:cobalt-zinc-cadmium resistance protein CzcA
MMMRRAMSSVRGGADPQMEITSGVAELSIRVDSSALAHYGLNVTDVEQAISSAGSGDVISEVLEGPRRYGVALRLPERYRSDPDVT